MNLTLELTTKQVRDLVQQMTLNLFEVDKPKSLKDLTTHALLVLEEAVLATLYHEDRYLSYDEIGDLIGIDKQLYAASGLANPIVNSVLQKLLKEKRVVNVGNPPCWKLTPNENERQASAFITQTQQQGKPK